MSVVDQLRRAGAGRHSPPPPGESATVDYMLGRITLDEVTALWDREHAQIVRRVNRIHRDAVLYWATAGFLAGLLVGVLIGLLA